MKRHLNNILFGLIGSFGFFMVAGWAIDLPDWQVYPLGAIAGGIFGTICQFVVNKVQLRYELGHESNDEYLWSFLGGFFLSPVASTLFILGAEWWWFLIAALITLGINYIFWK